MYPVALSAKTYAFMPHGVGFPRIYCRNDTQPLNAIIASSIEMALDGVKSKIVEVPGRSVLEFSTVW